MELFGDVHKLNAIYKYKQFDAAGNAKLVFLVDIQL